MLDTNVISQMVRNPDGAVAQRVFEVGTDSLCTSAIVASELRYGLRKKGSSRLSSLVENALERIAVVPYDEDVSWKYAEARFELEKIGQPIGYTDLFIAAHALALGLTLVTDNVREFGRVRGLKVENWQEPSP
ncbi:tRNA(fMet)-specific endonuclease VapC [Rhizobium azooxidifex]|uniref:Ribonuclease VapC n=1 Tax=Mycoplana azooxidifex TaxID=1636188 RepID=A0A7W6D8N1_9HYPH|nr:type II toxin-antitoxin system VapC family toxin [Mycoplana azooxidifex]MBB3978741.1 tRNA(fMet)-specific endonuclease VapC [Mycoplana azooxidifex]